MRDYFVRSSSFYRFICTVRGFGGRKLNKTRCERENFEDIYRFMMWSRISSREISIFP